MFNILLTFFFVTVIYFIHGIEYLFKKTVKIPLFLP